MWLCGNSTQNMFIASWQRSTSATVFSNQKPILRVPIGFLLVCILFGVLACLYSLLKNAWNWKRLLSKDLVFFTFKLNVRGVNGKSPLCPKKAAHCMHELVFNLSPVFNLNCPHCSMNHIESMISKALFNSLWFSITWLLSESRVFILRKLSVTLQQINCSLKRVKMLTFTEWSEVFD